MSMAMAGPPAAPDEDRTPYQGRGVAGGKLKSRRGAGAAAGSSALRKSTPYERPPLGRHASAGPQAAAQLTRVSASHKTPPKVSWLGGGFVSSASKILTNGASYLFSSFFGNPRMANASENEIVGNAALSVVEEELQLDIPKKYAEADGLNFENARSPANDGDADAQEESRFKEMEIFLKQSNLTREQCNRFIDVLKAKVQDSDVVDTKTLMPKSVEQSQHTLARIEVVRAGSTSHPDSQRWREERQRHRQEKGIGGKIRAYEQEDFNDHLYVEDGQLPSPRDIAKRYMDSRLSRASGSTLLPQSPVFKDEDHRSPLQVAVRNSITQGMVDGGLQKSKSTSAEIVLHSSPTTARTPYASSNNFQRLGENLVMDAKLKSGPSWTPYQTPLIGGREMLKRRNTVLEDVGTLAIPVRRTRIRTNSMSSHGLLASGNVLRPRFSSSASEPPAAAVTSSSLRRQSALGFDREKAPSANHIIDEKQDEINGLAFVPIQSSRTAQMILETLERMSPSPKGKSLDGELALIRERPPTMLSPSMLNKKAQRTMQSIEVPLQPVGSPEAIQVEDLGDVQSVKEPLIHPSKLSMQSLKGKENLESPRVDKVPATSLCNAKVSEANGFDYKTKLPSLGVSHATESILLKLPDAPMFEQSKSKGFRMSADIEELLSDDEGQGIAQAPSGTNAITEKSNVSVASDTRTFSVSVAPIIQSISVSGAAPTSSHAVIPTIDVQTSSSLRATISLSEASSNLTSGFTFPSTSFSGAKLEPPPTPKPMPSPLSQIDKSNTITTSATLLQDTNVSSSTAPGFPVLSSLSAEQSDTKKGSLFPTTSNTSQGQFGATSTVDSSNLHVAATSIFPQSFGKTQSTSAVSSPANFPKTSASMGSSLSFVSTSAFVSSYSAPSLPSFSFDGASSLSPLVPAFSQSIPVNSSTTTSDAVIISPIGSAAPGSVFSTAVSSAFPSYSTSTMASVFAASSTLAATSSSEKSLIASHPKTNFGLVGVGQSAAQSSQQSVSTILTPIFGNSVSASSTSSTSFVFGSSASSASTTAALSPSFSASPLSFGSAVSTSAPIFGAASGSPFKLTNAASVFGGNTAFSATGSSIPSFGMASAKSFGNFGQEAGSRSLPVDSNSTFGSFRVPTATSAGFGLTPTSASGTMSFSYGSTAASTSAMFAFGTSSSATESPIFGAKSPMFQPPVVFGSANTMPAFGTPAASVMSNDSNEQTIMEDNMSEEPAQITPMGPSQISLFGTTPPQAASPFTFGAPSNNASPGPGLFTFGGQSLPTPVPSAFGTTPQSQFAQPGQSGGLDNPFAGGFALGSGGERAGRKYIKAKRTVAKRGK